MSDAEKAVGNAVDQGQQQEVVDLVVSEKDILKAEKLAKERAILIEKVASNTTDTVPARVAWVLNHHPASRNSDVRLQVTYWKTFDNQWVSGSNVALEDLYKLTRLTDITRARAKIQNEYHLFKATDEVRQRRGSRQERERRRQIDDQPGHPTLTVYADESGKTGDFLLVGSIWFLAGPDVMVMSQALAAWREESGFKDELHFSEISNGNVSRYFEVLDILYSNSTTVSFKAIHIIRKGHTDAPRVLDDLLFHLIVRGVKHEHESGRAELPRSISIWKDEEEASRDKLMTANLMLRLKAASQSEFENRLHVSSVEVIDSKKIVFVQLADLFIGSLNRSLNFDPERISEHPKDRFSRAFLERFGSRTDELRVDQLGDMVVVDGI
ncbi:DUF3800 domain-containing protein [Rhodanobacter sp. C05]|uniref:DUF3800 domain-containing protein n=1 Tax=Rhodanobacter sp. C05 TaxID=1945855 RepID=UPI0009C4F107|nr:DUF3800 domain-containing protein [Rhodanobacter sp. C05]OOG42681.1 hypothetical protein B0E51_04325 [Rhodanobacter sp. C05]